MKRHLQIALPLVMAVVAISCGGNSTLDNTEAAVFLTVDVELYTPDVDICNSAGVDVSVTSMSISSNPKIPGAALEPQQDANLTRWVITPYRTDGGSTPSPVWSYDLLVNVPGGGVANLNNYRVYPSEYFTELPLSYLLPENGGYDPETGNTNIRQSLSVQIFGRTAGGKAVSTEPFPIHFNFYCGSATDE